MPLTSRALPPPGSIRPLVEISSPLSLPIEPNRELGLSSIRSRYHPYAWARRAEPDTPFSHFHSYRCPLSSRRRALPYLLTLLPPHLRIALHLLPPSHFLTPIPVRLPSLYGTQNPQRRQLLLGTSFVSSSLVPRPAGKPFSNHFNA